ncbi:MAG: hypothetical protein LH469_05145 [Frankiaceae bacterium]|nr:hypothetical protein [Frankiaceae bacterium]
MNSSWPAASTTIALSAATQPGRLVRMRPALREERTAELMTPPARTTRRTRPARTTRSRASPRRKRSAGRTRKTTCHQFRRRNRVRDAGGGGDALAEHDEQEKQPEDGGQ